MAALWGISGGLSGLLIDRGWEPLIVAFWRGLIGGVLALGWWPLAGGTRGRPNWRMVAPSVMAGLGVAGNLSFYCISIAHTSVAVAATLLYTAPLYVHPAALATGQERLRWTRGAALGLIMLGVVLLTNVVAVDTSQLSWLGILAGLAGGASYAVFIFGFRQASRHARPPSALAIAVAVFAVALLPLIDIGNAGPAPISHNLPLFIALSLVGGGLSFPAVCVRAAWHVARTGLGRGDNRTRDGRTVRPAGAGRYAGPAPARRHGIDHRHGDSAERRTGARRLWIARP